MLGFLDRNRSLPGPAYNRWLVPPAAMAIHLSIGQVYSFSVFKVPLTHLIGVTEPTAGDWSFPQIAWIFSIAILVLGLSTAVFGAWIDRAGPRKAMFVSACCFGGGFMIAAGGVHWHQLWLVYLGYGFVGGIGLGLGYLAPIAPLIHWFRDRPGMATGLAIMGFGGGAMIGAPLANRLMNHFHSASSTGVAPTMLVMGAIYFCFMMFGVFTIRVAPATPAQQQGTGDTPQLESASTRNGVLLWFVLLLNTIAGIGILEQASPMIQEVFRGRVNAAAAAGFVGLLSLFNMTGRFGWSTASDLIGRKWTFLVFFTLGPVLYALLPHTGAGGLASIPLFVLCAGVLLSMYGGGFATMPAYVRDLFGTERVNVIYGRILTAWGAAGVLGPLLVNELRDRQLAQGATPAEAYRSIMEIMAGLLAVGFVCNLMVRRPTGQPVQSTPTTPTDAAFGRRTALEH